MAQRGSACGLVILGLMVWAAVFAETFAPYDPLQQDISARMESPSWQHPLGTDSQGRDLFSRILFGSRIALIVGLLAVLLAMIAGGVLGLLAGYYGGVLDSILMRILAGLCIVPAFIWALVLMTILGAGVSNVIVAVAVGFLTPFARVTHGEVLPMRETRGFQATPILPTLLASLMAQGALRVSGAIRIEAALSFLGLGLAPPTPGWGSMIREGWQCLALAPWMAISPGLALLIALTGLHLLNNGLRHALSFMLHTRTGLDKAHPLRSRGRTLRDAS